MTPLTSVPLLWSFIVRAVESNPAAFDVTLYYRAYAGAQLVEVPVDFKNVPEPLPGAFWSAMVPPAMETAFNEAGYSLPA